MCQSIMLPLQRRFLGGGRLGRRTVGRVGFTLVELLVVMSIVALLIALLLPALGQARESGKATVCMLNARSLGMAFFTYTQDFKDTIPAAYRAFNASTDLLTEDPSQKGRPWDLIIWKYLPDTANPPIPVGTTGWLKQPRILQCPDDIAPRPAASGNPLSGRSYAMVATYDFNGPIGRKNSPTSGSIRYFSTGRMDGNLGASFSSFQSVGTTVDDYLLKASQVNTPAGTLLLAEAWEVSNGTPKWNMAGLCNDAEIVCAPTWFYLTPPHGGGIAQSFLYLDDHVALTGVKDTCSNITATGGSGTAPGGAWIIH